MSRQESIIQMHMGETAGDFCIAKEGHWFPSTIEPVLCVHPHHGTWSWLSPVNESSATSISDNYLTKPVDWAMGHPVFSDPVPVSSYSERASLVFRLYDSASATATMTKLLFLVFLQVPRLNSDKTCKSGSGIVDLSSRQSSTRSVIQLRHR